MYDARTKLASYKDTSLDTVTEPTERVFNPQVDFRMSILGKEGDTKVIWDPNNRDEVEGARKQFAYLVNDKKYSAFKVGRDGKQEGQRLKEFDPQAGSVILVPQYAGG